MKKTFLLVLLVSLAVGLFAAERTVEDAAAIAAQFTNNQPSLRQAGVAPRTAAAMTLAHKCMKKNGTEPAYYVFNQGNDAGFIIVSGDDRTEDVLVYAEQGSFDPEKVNPNFRFWLNRLQEEISFANDSNAVDKITPRKAVNVTAIGPLLKNDKGQEITWDQEDPYWNQCPMNLWRTSTHCLTGCVATAMAQIMYKWRYPEKGTGSHSYTWDCCKTMDEETWECLNPRSQTLSQDFSTVTFDWDNMLPSYYGKSATTAQKNAVATLMYCCGIAAEMQYGDATVGGSGAWTDVMGLGATTYFGYEADKFITTLTQRQYGGASAFEPAEFGVTTDEFEQYFNADLEAGRPIIMGGEDSEAGGHEFVCDGRDTRGYFHINWGWEGDGNCYCKLSALKPQGESYDFSSNLDAMIGLRPAQQEVINVTGVTVAPTSATLKINGKQQLTATIAPANATDKAVTWKSNNTSVATVSETGLVKGIAQGTAIITVTTHDGNKTATDTITVTNEVEPAKDFTLVTSASDLSAGDELIIVSTYQETSYAATSALTATKSTGYLGREEVTITNNTITLPDGSPVAIFTLAGKAGEWVLSQENGNLGATAAKKLAWSDGTTTWTISIEDNLATIASTNTSYGRILMNNTNPRFCNYTSNTSASMLLPQIYARSSTPTALPEWKQETKIQKFILDGQLFIMRDNKLYNAQGQLLR